MALILKLSVMGVSTTHHERDQRVSYAWKSVERVDQFSKMKGNFRTADSLSKSDVCAEQVRKYISKKYLFSKMKFVSNEFAFRAQTREEYYKWGLELRHFSKEILMVNAKKSRSLSFIRLKAQISIAKGKGKWDS